MRLTPYERAMLEGEYGRLKQVCMEKIIQYAEVLGADELCAVTKATVYMGAHPYLEAVKSDNYDEIFSKMYVCVDETIPLEPFAEECFSQTCVGPCCQYRYKELNLTKEFYDKNQQYLNLTRDAGVSIAGSCTPYLSGWIPTYGEHFVTTESSNVLISNSLFGACGNSDGIEAAIWSAVTGRTPKWGNHIMENRKGTHVFRIECPLVTHTDWDVAGYTVGRKLPPHAIPVITGDFPPGDLSKYKLFCASLATTSGAEMFHIVGMTPEAPTLEKALGSKAADEIVLTRQDYAESVACLCDAGGGPVDMITIGCPHLSLEEIRDIASYIKGKRVRSGIRVFVWTDIAIKALADVNGYTHAIEEAGAYVMTSGCPLVIGRSVHEGARGIACDGAKQAHYIRSETTANVYYGSKYQCLDAAVSGKWEDTL